MDRPKSIERWSPNFTPKDPGREISCVVIHATAGARDGALERLCDPCKENPSQRVSAHYLIDKFGVIYKLVEEQNEAWHAGVSSWRDVPYVNRYSIGIELENMDDGQDPWPVAQVSACAELVAAICEDYGISKCDVVGHKDVAPGRKPDPVGFDFDNFRTMLAMRGVLN